jgi:NADH dehydrogenase [ubiquinone] 1 alpha subcomplex assembly factor 7
MLKFSRNLRILSSRNYCYKPVSRVPVRKSKSSLNYDKTPEDISLVKQIEAKIKMTGALTVANYMKEILTNPGAGYYMSKKDVFGQEGDFITSTEITQIFNELVAVWCLNEWYKIGSPSPLQLVELGPGKGTLIKDIIKVFAHFKASSNLSIHLVEISPSLSKLQSQLLCVASQEVEETEETKYYRRGETVSGIPIFWYRQIQDVPNSFTIVLAHEFFDALPIHKFQKDKDGLWKEVLVDADLENKEQLVLRHVLSRGETPASKVFTIKGGADEKRDHVEVSFESEIILEHLAERIEDYGGFGLIIDYGHLGDKTDTFRAFRKHQLHDPLIDPGTADLTADVDFKKMKSVLDQKLVTVGPIEQRKFLKNMEIQARLQKVTKEVDSDEGSKLEACCDMLTNPQKMGDRFKFLAFFPAVLKEHLEKFPVRGFEKTE